MWLTRLAILRPILIWMALAALAVLGVHAYLKLPAELNPRTDIPALTVTTIYPGAGPREIESQITRPLEDAVGTVAGVKGVYSSSQPNVSVISVEFQVGTRLDVAVADVRERADSARGQLPAEARPPMVAKLDINALPILYMGIECRSLTLAQLRYLADNTIRPRLERVHGVAAIQVAGGEQSEVQVAVDNDKLAQRGLTIEDVVNSLKASGRDVPGGRVTQGREETDIRLTGAYNSMHAIRETQILAPQLAAEASRNQASQAGEAIARPPAPALTVADVATVSQGMAERTEIDRINGREGVGLIFSKASDANTVTVVDEIERTLASLRPSLPRELNSVVLKNDAATVREALTDVNATLVLGAFLAMAVILLFLHNFRGMLIVSMAIPACMVATFLVLQVAGFTLNQMTLLALSLSVGILVDDSIVVLESITRHLRYGEAPREAAFNGRTEIGFADITTTLVDVVVFLPIAFMGGIVGSFFKQFGLTVAGATLFSLVVSFSVTPMLASRWYRADEDLTTRRGLFSLFERFYRFLDSRYRLALRIAMENRGVVVVTGVAALAFIFLVSYHRLGTDFLPSTDLSEITVNIEMPPGSSLQATDEAARGAERVIGTIRGVEAIATNVGQILGGFGAVPQQGAQYAQITVRLLDRAGWMDRLFRPSYSARRMRGRSDEEIAQEMSDRLKSMAAPFGARIAATAIRSAEGVSAPIQIELLGADLDVLTGFASDLRNRMAAVPGVLDPDISIRTGKPEVQAAIDRRRAAELGVPSALAGSILRDSVTGNTDATFRSGGHDIPIRVRLAGIQRDRPSDIAHVVVGSDDRAQPIQLADVARLVRRTGPTNIDRKNGQRVVTVSANLDSRVPLSTAQQAIDNILKTLPHPGINCHWAGDSEQVAESAYYFASALLLAIMLVYIVMASLFNSLSTPLVIMCTLPMALIGALGALVLTGETMSLVAAIGIIMLVGLMGRNAILLLDYTNTLRARGYERNAAIEQAGATRLRPILMTTTATIVGMLPVALRIGRASEVRAPMAIVVIGGLLVSTVLTLIMIPVIYSLFDDASGWFARRRREDEPAQA